MAYPPSSPASDDIDPLALIIAAIRENSDVSRAALAQAKATRQAMAETDLLVKRLAETTSDNLRSMNKIVQNFTTSRDEMQRAKSNNWSSAVGGFFFGMSALEIATLAYRYFFGS